MIRIAALLRSPVFLTLLLAATGLHALAWVRDLFIDHDVIIYSLIGEALYREGAVPYAYAFDHKPILTYVLYGPLALLDAGFNIYMIYGFAWLAALALFIHVVVLNRRHHFALVLALILIATFRNVDFNGNTEVIFVTLQIVAVVLLLRSGASPAAFALSALATTVAFNVNYVSAMPLLPALLYCLWISSGSALRFILRALLYGALCLALIALVFGAMALGGGDVAGYLDMQGLFLSGYDARYGMSMGFMAKALAGLGIAALSWLPAFSPAPAQRPLRNALTILILVAIATFVLNGKYFAHYLFMCTAPAAVILLLMNQDALWRRVGLVAILAAAALLQALAGITLLAERRMVPDQRLAYAPIATLVGDAPVLSMGSSVVPLYYSGVRPYQPIVWYNHAQIMYGDEGADAYFVANLMESPPFVMTGIDFCDSWGAGWQSCEMLETGYTPTLSGEDLGYTAPGYVIWEPMD